MPKVTVVQVIYNNRRYIEPVFNSIFAQTFKDFQVVAVIAGNADGSKELLMEKFPQVKVLDPGYNIGFAKGHNLVFEQYPTEFFQLVNPDLILEPNYLEEILKVFAESKVGAATGKLYQFSQLKSQPEDFRDNRILDTTGVVISRSGRARDRGQHEIDLGQYDDQKVLQAVSAAGAMYRRAALEAVKLAKPETNGFEYFDEDFHSYWEDVDLTWRMVNLGWGCRLASRAIGYHGRGAGSSKRGYADLLGFIKHHRGLNPVVRQLNYKNHIFMYLKNSSRFYPQFFLREIFMFIYILIFEPGTLKVLPEFFRLLPKIWKKRKMLMTKLHV